MPTSTHPLPIITAPSHHHDPTVSANTTAPSNAVMMKLLAVLITDTFVVDGPAVSARVKNAHMTAFESKLRRKKMTLMTSSRKVLCASLSPSWKMREIEFARAVVCVVVVLMGSVFTVSIHSPFIFYCLCSLQSPLLIRTV